MTQAAYWTAACIAVVPPFGLAVAAALRGTVAQRFVALQGGATLAVLLLAMVTFAIDQPSSIDLALAMALLGLPGSLVIAVFVERWL